MADVTKVETVREVLGRKWPLVPDDVERRDTFREAWQIIKESGLLDARIIRGVCETCGGDEYGRREFAGHVWRVSNELCPTCQGKPPVSVVMPEAREAFAKKLADRFAPLEYDGWDALTEPERREWLNDADEFAAALLPGVERAREVVTVASNPHDVDFKGEDGKYAFVRVGDRIVLLIDKEAPDA